MLTSYNELQMLVWQELMGIIAPNALTMVGDIISPTPEEIADGKYCVAIRTPHPQLLQQAEALSGMNPDEIMSGVIPSLKAPPVRHSWPKGGAPDWRIDDDVLFMQLSEAEDELNRPVDDEWLERGEDFTRRQGITRVFNLKLNAYGPNCYDNLLRIRMEFLRGIDAMKKEKVYLVPERAPIIRAPELFQGRWWNRADTTLKLNALFIFDTEVTSITSVKVGVFANRQDKSKAVIRDLVEVE